MKKASTKHAFVPRLWATRRISFLVDQLRQAGASDQPAQVGQTIFNNPKYKELADEILRLSTEFGVLTEYTSFLAREGTNLADWDRLNTICAFEINSRAIQNRSGRHAVTQGKNLDYGKKQKKVRLNNAWTNAENRREEAGKNVQQVADRALFFSSKAKCWIEGRIVSGKSTLKIDAKVLYGTTEYEKVLNKLVAQGRQGVIARKGEILIHIEGKNVLVQNHFGK